MKWERRKKTIHVADATPSSLPRDYLRLVEKTLTKAVTEGLVELKKTYPVCEFQADGAIFSDEVFVTITLSHGTKNITATTVYASADFNPLAEKPTLESILSACVDAAGTIFSLHLDPTQPEKIAQLAHHSLSALEDAPFEWSKADFVPGAEKIGVWVKIDKSNPHLENLADKWLAENDPEYKKKSSQRDQVAKVETEDFLEERLEAIKNAKSGSGTSGGSGPIRH